MAIKYYAYGVVFYTVTICAATIITIQALHTSQALPPSSSYEFTIDSQTGIFTLEESARRDTGTLWTTPGKEMEFSCHGITIKRGDQISRQNLITIFVERNAKSLCPPQPNTTKEPTQCIHHNCKAAS